MGNTQVEAVIFDLDGVLVDSERAWDQARRQFTIQSGGRWVNEATRAMMGMSSLEWSQYMRDQLGIPLEPSRISAQVVERMEALYRKELPLIPGAVEAVERMAARWRLGLASSANRELIDLVLKQSGLVDRFAVSVSSEEVARGKPAPDVYLEAAARLEVPSGRCVAIEDSTNGIRSGRAAGMLVVAIPNRALPPDPRVLDSADLVLESLGQLDAAVVEDMVSKNP